jgi:predicted DNA-binding protein (MmcQ/YjbR family)
VPQEGPSVDRLRGIALALPEATEEITWGDDLNFRVNKKIFLFPGNEAMTFKADPGEKDALLADPAGRFAPAAYVGRFGWLTMQFGKKPDWNEIEELVVTSYRLIAPKRLVKQLDADRS